MKKRLIVPFCILLLFFTAGQLSAASPLGNLRLPFQEFYSIKTKYFEILYPAESRESAYELAGYADEVYDKINSIIQSKHQERIKVVLSPNAQYENGFCSPVPYTHIVLADFRVSTLRNDRHYFREVFLHELTHAISLNQRSDFFEGFTKIFGNVMSPNLTMPQFMIEGVTVSLESLEGFGRANDPAVKHQIREDILEGEFKSPDQAAGPYDLYPYGNVYYHYGGLFNTYLQQTYGMDKYSELWRKNGGALPYTFEWVFQDVYGVSLSDAWSGFSNSIALTNTVSRKLTFLKPKSMQTYTMTDSAVSVNGKIYFSDSMDAQIKVYDTRKKNLEVLLQMTGRLAVSPDEKTLAIYTTTYENRQLTSAVLFYNLEKKRFEDKVLRNSGSTAFVRDGVAAIRARRHITDLVLFKNDGTLETLLYGSETTAFAEPVGYGPDKLAFIKIENGVRTIGLYDLSLKKAEEIILPFQNFKNLSVDDGRIYFSANRDETVFRPGYILNDSVYLATNRLIGGVSLPIAVDGSLYYFGRFSSGDKMLKFPEDLSNMGLEMASVRKQPYENTNSLVTIGQPLPQESTYNGFLDFLPHFWIPYLTSGKILVDGVGFMTLLQDPLYENSVYLYATYNYLRPFGNVIMNAVNASTPLRLSWNFSDVLPYYLSMKDYVRRTSGNIDLSYRFYWVPFQNSVYLGAGFGEMLTALDNGFPSPYEWAYTLQSTVVSGYAGLTVPWRTFVLFDWFSFDLVAYSDYQIQNRVFKEEAQLNLYSQEYQILLKINGAYSQAKLFNPASENWIFATNRYLPYKEYSNLRNYSQYYVSADISYPFYTWEIQHSPWLLPVYFSRMKFYAGYRGAYLESGYYQSLYTRAVLKLDFLYGGYSGFPGFNLYIEGNYRINDNKFGLDYSFMIYF